MTTSVFYSSLACGREKFQCHSMASRSASSDFVQLFNPAARSHTINTRRSLPHLEGRCKCRCSRSYFPARVPATCHRMLIAWHVFASARILFYHSTLHSLSSTIGSTVLPARTWQRNAVHAVTGAKDLNNTCVYSLAGDLFPFAVGFHSRLEDMPKKCNLIWVIQRGC